MVLAIGAEYNLERWQLDYNTAFLNVDVTEEVYVKMAPGYEELDDFFFVLDECLDVLEEMEQTSR